MSRIPLQMSYTLATTCLHCILSQFVTLCNPFRSGNQRHGNLVAEHELRQAATRICRATCMRIQGATRRCDQSRATCMLVCTGPYVSEGKKFIPTQNVPFCNMRFDPQLIIIRTTTSIVINLKILN